MDTIDAIWYHFTLGNRPLILYILPSKDTQGKTDLLYIPYLLDVPKPQES